MKAPAGCLRVILDPAASGITVIGRATGHRFELRFEGLAGELAGDPADLEGSAAAALTLPMASFRSGDVLRDFHTRRYLAPKHHPNARLVLDGVRVDRAASGEGPYEAGQRVELTVLATLHYRGAAVPVEAAAAGQIDGEGAFAAEASVTVDIRAFGLKPPRFLILKVDPEVEVTATLVGRVAPRT